MEKVISEVQIIPVKPNNGLVAFALCVLNEELYLGSIGIFTLLNKPGFRLTHPTRKVGRLLLKCMTKRCKRLRINRKIYSNSENYTVKQTKASILWLAGYLNWQIKQPNYSKVLKGNKKDNFYSFYFRTAN